MNSTDTNLTDTGRTPMESAATLLGVMAVASTIPGWDSQMLRMASFDRWGLLVQVSEEAIAGLLGDRLGLTLHRRTSHPGELPHHGISHRVAWKGFFQGQEIELMGTWLTDAESEDAIAQPAQVTESEAEGSQA